ncbi:MAG TPA: glycosyltransferase family 1 protein [Gallionella sp.]|nr:glycosyltransferase family 1 protein [Gallionella sp.]
MAERKLRIAVVTETYPPEINGVAMTISRMVEGLRQKHVVELIRPRQNPQDSAKQGPAFQEVLVRGFPIPRYQGLKLGLPAKQRLIKLWTSQRPDVVHLVTEGPLGSSALSAARKLGIPVSSDFHTNFHSYSQHYGFGWLQKTVAAYLRKLHNRTDTTLVPTNELRDTLEQEGYQNLQVVARGVETALFHPGKRSRKLRAQWGLLADDDLAVIYVGRISAEKNLPLVLRTFEAMQAVNPKLKLVMVGDGPVRAELQRKNSEYIFAGMRTGEDLAAHYASGDIFLFPSMTETYGNVTVEAMASGLAVVAYRYAAAAEHIVHGENGLHAEYGNAEEFIKAACGLAADGPRIEQMRRQAHQTMLKLDWQNIVEEFEQALAQLASKPESRHDTPNLQPATDPNLG